MLSLKYMHNKIDIAAAMSKESITVFLAEQKEGAKKVASFDDFEVKFDIKFIVLPSLNKLYINFITENLICQGFKGVFLLFCDLNKKQIL